MEEEPEVTVVETVTRAETIEGMQKAWERPPAPSAIEPYRPPEELAPDLSTLSEAKQDMLKRLQREQSAVEEAQQAVMAALDWREGRLTTSEDRKRVLVTLREWAEECERNIKVFERQTTVI